MYNDFPIYFNQTTIPTPKSWSESFKTIDNTQTSEGGTDIIDITRKDKLSISVSTGCLDTTAKMYKEFYMLDSFVLKRYDLLTEAYEERNVRMTDFSASKVEKSEELAVSNALWSVSFKLEEF